ILRSNELCSRDEGCSIDGDDIAEAVADGPCDNSAGPMTSSGYILLNADQIPLVAPAFEEASKFRADVVHELFHIYEYGLNLEAMSYTCAQGSPEGTDDRKSWLTEASAEWASFGFFPQDDKPRRTDLFKDFQQYRDGTVDGLHSTDGLLPYQAALYLEFLQQQA